MYHNHHQRMAQGYLRNSQSCLEEPSTYTFRKSSVWVVEYIASGKGWCVDKNQSILGVSLRTSKNYLKYISLGFYLKAFIWVAQKFSALQDTPLRSLTISWLIDCSVIRCYLATCEVFQNINYFHAVTPPGFLILLLSHPGVVDEKCNDACSISSNDMPPLLFLHTYILQYTFVLSTRSF